MVCHIVKQHDELIAL